MVTKENYKDIEIVFDSEDNSARFMFDGIEYGSICEDKGDLLSNARNSIGILWSRKNVSGREVLSELPESLEDGEKLVVHPKAFKRAIEKFGVDKVVYDQYLSLPMGGYEQMYIIHE